MANTTKTNDLKFNYNTAELYISKYNIYGSKLFVLVDIKNNTLIKGWSASSVCSPDNCCYRVLTDVTQNKVREIYNSMLAQGYNEIKESEFEQARNNAKA